MRRVVVTGGLGFVGSAIISQLLKHGFQVLSIDNLAETETLPVGSVPNLSYSYGDPALADELKPFEPFSIIHCANSAYVQESISNPLKYFENNVSEAISMLTWIKKLKIERFVFSSSCAVYGEPTSNVPIDEQSPLVPVSPYGLSKKMAEDLFMVALRHLGIGFLSLRYFNVAGAILEDGIFERHSPETHVIPLMIEAAKSNGNFKLFGRDLNTPDGSPVRDFIHIRDLAQAHLRGLWFLEQHEGNFAVNLGSGRGTSLIQLAAEIQRRFGEFELELLDRRTGDPESLVANIGLAKKLLDWSPTNSDIRQIIDDLKLPQGNPST